MGKFDYSLSFETISFRENPQLYRVGVGEQGVLLVQPYKDEILPHWRFKTVEIAERSAKKIYQLFKEYKKKGDFVGMDMSRKFLQMGYTRARRYANHPGGRKYVSNPQKAKSPDEKKRLRRRILPQSADWNTNEKAEAAAVFYGYYQKVRSDRRYVALKREHQRLYG